MLPEPVLLIKNYPYPFLSLTFLPTHHILVSIAYTLYPSKSTLVHQSFPLHSPIVLYISSTPKLSRDQLQHNTQTGSAHVTAWRQHGAARRRIRTWLNYTHFCIPSEPHSHKIRSGLPFYHNQIALAIYQFNSQSYYSFRTIRFYPYIIIYPKKTQYSNYS